MTTSGAEQEEAARELIELVRHRLPLLTSAPRSDLLARQFAAGALARCVALADGLEHLTQAGRPDLLGLLARALWETWLLGLYALLAPDDAMDMVLGSHKRQARILDERLGLNQGAVLASWEVDEDKVNWEDLARRVTRLLRASGDPDADVTTTYEIVYRGESLVSTHAGLASIGAYIIERADRMELSSEPPCPMDPDHRRIDAALYIGHLASRVFEAFGVGDEQLTGSWGALDRHATDIPAADVALGGPGPAGIPQDTDPG